jgi:hypothetical protein
MHIKPTDGAMRGSVRLSMKAEMGHRTSCGTAIQIKV